MSIELHCPSCTKLIRAPDDAGGKRGKCPYCKKSVYIPMPPDDTDVIGLAPIDDEAERQARELRDESTRYAATVAHDTKGRPEGESAGSASRGPQPAPVPGDVIDLPEAVERYVLAMRDSDLSAADKAIATLSKAGSRARDYVEGLMLDEVPPTYENVPPPLMKGFLKKLIQRLG